MPFNMGSTQHEVSQVAPFLDAGPARAVPGGTLPKSALCAKASMPSSAPLRSVNSVLPWVAFDTTSQDPADRATRCMALSNSPSGGLLEGGH